MIKPTWYTFNLKPGNSLKLPAKLMLKNGYSVSYDNDILSASLKKNNSEVGFEIFSKQHDNIHLLYIDVPNKNDRKQGFGNLLRALSVMLMKENKVSNMHLEALPEAFKFHYKNGFRTANPNVSSAIDSMESVITSGFDTLTEKALVTKNELVKVGEPAIISADKLFDEFLEYIIKNNISINDLKLPSTIYMKLKPAQVEEYKIKYNKFLKDFGVDYII